jgi:putative sigma-54 modulation protein
LLKIFSLQEVIFMEITVTFRRMEPAESLRVYAVEKLSKIKKYLDSPFEAHIVLEVEKFRHMADVTLSLDGTWIKALEETGDMYSAIDQVMDKIEKQVKRHRSKIKNRRGDTVRGEEILEGEPGAQGPRPLSEEPIITVEKLVAKPMDTEEAAMQLSLTKQDFLVFRNSRSSEINVMYRRKDGNFGLIEPAS